MKKTKPRVLLVGVGRFGAEHLKTWQRLEGEGLVELAGGVVATESSRRLLVSRYGIPGYTDLPAGLLEQVNAVDIVTPSHSHHDIAKRCLRYAHVLVEKPLATTLRDARDLVEAAGRSKRVLMVNHLYHFHPVLEELKKLAAAIPENPRLISACFVNPDPPPPGLDKAAPNLEMLHYFYLVEDLFQCKPLSCFSTNLGMVNEISLRYQRNINAVFELGWRGVRKHRTLQIHYANKKLLADFLDGSVEVMDRESARKTFVHDGAGPLERVLRRFLQVIGAKTGPRRPSFPGVREASRAVDVALNAVPGPRKRNPRAAVIGGGIFGATCAVEMGRYCDVLLVERHDELMTESSYLNQWRHHSGFHYPRSFETIQEIQAAAAEFEEVYGPAVLRDIVSYYFTSRLGNEITRDKYLQICRENKLCFSIEDPPRGLVDLHQLSLSLRTDEAVLDFLRLRSRARAKLDENARIECALGTKVEAAHFSSDGGKVLTLRSRGKSRRETFDYLINATYANSNLIADWFHWPTRRLRFDLCEMLALEIPMPPVSLTILDGPFTSLICTGRDNVFLLSHIHQSLLASEVPSDGLPPKWGEIRSNRVNLMKHASLYLPVLEKSRFIESRFSVRAVTAYSEDFDGRPTVITKHGFGCWSVLGGKIVTCVSNARDIARQIFSDETSPLHRAGK